LWRDSLKNATGVNNLWGGNSMITLTIRRISMAMCVLVALAGASAPTTANAEVRIGADSSIALTGIRYLSIRNSQPLVKTRPFTLSEEMWKGRTALSEVENGAALLADSLSEDATANLGAQLDRISAEGTEVVRVQTNTGRKYTFVLFLTPEDATAIANAFGGGREASAITESSEGALAALRKM
jgi:hypothetical protein